MCGSPAIQTYQQTGDMPEYVPYISLRKETDPETDMILEITDP